MKKQTQTLVQNVTTGTTGLVLRATSSATVMAVLVTVVGAGRKFV